MEPTAERVQAAQPAVARHGLDAALAQMHHEVLKVGACKDRRVRWPWRCRRLRAHERLPCGQVVVASLRRDVVEVNALAEELVEVGVEVSHGDSGSFPTVLSPPALRKCLRRLK